MARKRKAVKSTEGKNIELEGKRKEDNAWYECRVSLSSAAPSRTTLKVHFSSFKTDESDTILQKDEAMACLRVRSMPLEDGECLQVKEGETIIALQKTQAGRPQFFDAEVEKVHRLKHSNKVFCRCTFEIKWLESSMKGETVIVPASSIKRLAQESIWDHPVISVFFESVQSTNGPPLSPGAFPAEDSDIESDIHARLEQQIEEIAKLADTNENAGTEDISMKHRRVNAKPRDSTASDECTVNGKDVNGYTPIRTSARKRNIISSKAILREPATIKASAFLDIEKRPRLSPLAARAALAAAVWDLPLGKQNMNGLSNVLVPKNQDSIDTMDQSSLKKPLDKVSLNLSDTHFDMRPHTKRKKGRKSVLSTTRGKSSKQSSSNNFHECPTILNGNQVHQDCTDRKYLQFVSPDASMLQRTKSVSVPVKPGASSDIASTAKGSSAMTDVAVSLPEQRIHKRQRETSKEVNSTRSRKNSVGIAGTRSSPRFQVCPLFNGDKQIATGSQQIVEAGRYKEIGTENIKKEWNVPSVATMIKSRKPRKAQYDDTKNFIEEVKESLQENGYKCNKKASREASGRPKNAKHLLIDCVSENSNETVQESPQGSTKRVSKATSIWAKKGKHLLTNDVTENGYNNDKKASNTASVKVKKIKTSKVHVEFSSLTCDSTETSVRAVEEGPQNDPEVKKRDSKELTSRAPKSRKSITSTHLENSNGADKSKSQPLVQIMTSAVTPEEGENSRKDTVNDSKCQKAWTQTGPKVKKHASTNLVARSSPRLRFLHCTRSQTNTTIRD